MSTYPDVEKARKQVQRRRVAYNRSPTGPVSQGEGMPGSMSFAELSRGLERLTGVLSRYGWTSAPGRVEP